METNPSLKNHASSNVGFRVNSPVLSIKPYFESSPEPNATKAFPSVNEYA
jgi:hypothetical protein